MLQPEGRGSIHATLFDLGIYPAAIPFAIVHLIALTAIWTGVVSTSRT